MHFSFLILLLFSFLPQSSHHTNQQIIDESMQQQTSNRFVILIEQNKNISDSFWYTFGEIINKTSVFLLIPFYVYQNHILISFSHQILQVFPKHVLFRRVQLANA